MKILVVGDSCVDDFVYGDIKRISPEAPIPVFVPSDNKQNDGMAKNVFNNVKSLGSDAEIITNINGIIKRRYVDNRSGQMVLRVDEHDWTPRINIKVLQGISGNKVVSYGNEETIEHIDAIIISDYCKGFLEESDIEYICENNFNVFVDTKKQLGDWILSADFIKINELEYEKNHQVFADESYVGVEKLIVTLGSKGCRYKGEEYSVPKVSVKDVSGAGDTFLAGLVVKYVETNDIVESIKFAQKCTTQVVQQKGVAQVKLGDV